MTASRRVLVTGLATYWGGRLARALEEFDEIEAIIGVDTTEPTHELERTEFVKVGHQHRLIERNVEGAEIDTVVDTRLVVNSLTTSRKVAHETNVIGTLNILAACSAADSPVRKLVFKSAAHYYGCRQEDPAFFTEEMERRDRPGNWIERDIVEADDAVTEFAERNPRIAVTVLRYANVIGPEMRTPHMRMLALPLVPMILGFDPRYQFVHADDVVHTLEHAVIRELPGVYNVAADGVLLLSEAIGLLGKRPLPVLPPFGTGLIVAPLRQLGLRIPDEMLDQLRFGRGLDNRKLKATGFEYEFTTREAVLKLREHFQTARIVRAMQEPYRYQHEVETFLRSSRHVRERAGAAEQPE
ncbi:MAG: UDP-glucose 4-epimerase [Solirubrobacterales bacterium]|nr:UDP-glucose 4-epimerase [Solirubrobacterales bacterium]